MSRHAQCFGTADMLNLCSMHARSAAQGNHTVTGLLVDVEQAHRAREVYGRHLAFEHGMPAHLVLTFLRLAGHGSSQPLHLLQSLHSLTQRVQQTMLRQLLLALSPQQAVPGMWQLMTVELNVVLVVSWEEHERKRGRGL